MTERMSNPFELLLGRKSFEVFAGYWPHHEDEGPGINQATKYVVNYTLTTHEWKKSVYLNGDVVEEIKKLKVQDSPCLQVHGSSDLIQTLLKHDLVDEFWLKIFPVSLGAGTRMFGGGTIPPAFR